MFTSSIYLDLKQLLCILDLPGTANPNFLFAIGAFQVLNEFNK